MKLDKNNLLDQLAVVIDFVKRFRFLVAFTIFSAMYGYTMTQVNNISSQQPSQAQINQKTSGTRGAKVDPELVEQIEALEDQNVQVKTIFNEARQNPFAE